MFKKIGITIFAIICLLLLYLTSRYNYLFFHSLVEIFSICIAFTIFLLTWNAEKYLKNNYYIVIGIAYLFIGLLDIFHTLSYKGMAIFKDYDYYANQLWVATRFFESITMAVAFVFIGREKKVNIGLLFAAYATITSLILASVFYWRIFPVCFIDGYGLTPFKKISEYVICIILLFCLYFLYKFRNRFNEKVTNYLGASIILTVFSELSFTLYTDNYGILNMVGHYFKIFAFYFIYKVIIEQGIRAPYEVIFRDLKISEQMMEEKNCLLERRSNIDGLTGLYNHRFLYERLEEEILLCARYSRKLSIVLFDLDYFKRINDGYGHQKGDEVLIAVAEKIRECIRATDIATRYGGEEYLVVLLESTAEVAYLTAERIRKAVENLTFENGMKITISGGVVEFKGENSTAFVKAADDKLYLAKNNGRNRIEK